MKREEIEQHYREFHGIKNVPLTSEQIREIDWIQNLIFCHDQQDKKGLILIENLDLSIRCLNLLKANKIIYLNQLAVHSREHLIKQMNFGFKSLQEIENIMKVYGLKFQEINKTTIRISL